MRSIANGNGAAVELERLGKRFGERVVLSGIDLSIRPGEFLGIVGPSGSGKSTLLRILSGLEEPTSGAARVRGTHLGRASANGAVRVVFQEPRLLPWRSVLDNVCVGSRALACQGRDVLERVGLGERLHDYPGVLSGGQRQRVALARALVHEPQVLLLDEPFASLDALTRLAAQRLVESLWTQHGFTAVLVTHDVEEAVLLCDRVLVLEGGRVRRSVEVSLARPRARHLPEVGRLSLQLLSSILGTTFAEQALLGKPAEVCQPPRQVAHG
ncbi:MAG TPA: ABC transporter ATP-binding protein [Polyangiaceae bacterium]|nr:ABC transporter ATP-binding protein [Polyangiaceae bacterium]